MDEDNGRSTSGRSQGYPTILWTSVISALLGAFQFGYHLGVLNTSLAAVAEDLSFKAEAGGAVVVSGCLLGAIVGALTAGRAADTWGPRTALLFNNSFFILGSLLCATSPAGFWGLLIGRVLVGIGAGAASLCVPRYVSEVAPISKRGAFTTFNQVLICVGILVAYLVGLPYDSDASPHLVLGGLRLAWWRLMFGLALAPSLLQCFGMARSLESPVWLSFKGDRAQAIANEKAFLGPAWLQEAEIPQEESGSEPLLASPAEEEREEAGGWGTLLERRYRRIMMLAAGLPLLQQASGINSVILYSSQVLKTAGLGSPVLGSIAVGVVNLVGSCGAVPLMDRAGRRPLLALSHAGMAVCLFALSLTTALPVSKVVEGRVSLAAVLMFIFSYGMGSGPVPWVYLPEVLPDHIKGAGGALGTALNWTGNLIIGLIFPSMLKHLHLAGSYTVFTVLNAAAFAFVLAFVVETKRRSLHEITEQLLLR